MSLFIYLFIFIIRKPIPDNAGSARINAKERKARRGKERRRIEAQRVKHPTPSFRGGAHQCRGKRQEGKKSEKSEGEKRDRGTKGETSNPIPSN